MSSLDPLESRNLSTGIAKRTLKNLEFIKQAFDRGEDVHVVTQTLNSLLGLLVFPVENEKDTKLFEYLKSKSLDPPDYFLAIQQCSPDFPLVPSLKIFQFEKCKNLGDFFTRLRNAIVHRRLDFSSDSHNLDVVFITMQDKTLGKPIDWEIRISAKDLEELSRYIANLVIDKHL